MNRSRFLIIFFTRTFLVQRVTLWSFHLFSRWIVSVQQVCPHTIRNLSMLQHLLKLTGQHICRVSLRKKHFSCRRRSLKTRVVHTANDSTQLSIKTTLMSKNSSWSNPVAVPTGSKLFLSLWNALDAHKFTHLKSKCVRLRLRSRSGIRRCARVCKFWASQNMEPSFAFFGHLYFECVGLIVEGKT